MADSYEVLAMTLGIKEMEIKSGVSADPVVKIHSSANTLSSAGAGLAIFHLSSLKITT